MTSTENGHARIVAPPPLIFLAAIVTGVLLSKIYPINVWGLSVTWPGIVLAGAGFLLAMASFSSFHKDGATANPYTATEALSSSGPYRFTRNPMYLSLTLLQLGIGVMLNTAWVLLMVIPALVVIHYGVILREERYLESKFGDEYRHYKEKVHRWI